MKKIVRLTETDLIKLVKRLIKEGDVYGSFGNSKRNYRGDEYVDIETDRYADDEKIYNIGSDDDFDTEEFDDYESFDAKYPNRKSLKSPVIFNKYREITGRPFKLKTRKNRDI